MDYSPPGAMTSRGWNLFSKEFKKEAPIRFWIDNTFRRNVILPIKWKYDAIHNWFRVRTVRRLHVISTGLTPGYYSTGERILHGNFNLLKNFVEIEQARATQRWSDDYEMSVWERYLPFYGLLFPYRDPAAGIKHFEWAATLDDPTLPPGDQSVRQARDAKEVLILYKWWITDRPGRTEIPYPKRPPGKEVSLDVFSDDEDDQSEEMKNYRQLRHDAMDKRIAQESAWEDEDSEMLIRLMKIRAGLWS